MARGSHLVSAGKYDTEVNRRQIASIQSFS